MTNVNFEGYNYYVPISSPKNKHYNMKDDIDFFRIMKDKKQPKTPEEEASLKTPRTQSGKRFRSFRGKQNATSIYFLLWAIFTALSLVIVLLSVFTQQFVLAQSYREQASREIFEKGWAIERVILQEPPDWTGGNYSGYLRALSKNYDVDIYILSEDGRLLFPR